MEQKLTIAARGVNHDISPAELDTDVWNNCQNVLFNSGFAVASPGWLAAMGTPLFRPLWFLPIETPTSYFWIYVGNNTAEDAGGIGVTDGATHWDITPAGGWAVMKAGDITGGVLNGIPVMNNGANPPVGWDLIVTNLATTLPGWPANTLCKALRPFKYNLIAMNITDGSGTFADLVIWSSSANPGALPDSWDPLPGNEAGNFTISATSGGIIDGGQMRDQFMVYKSHSSAIMQYIAGQYVFSNRKAFVTSGILARNCWAEMYGQHYVITDGDFIQHNGQEVTSLIDGTNREYLFGQINPETYEASFLVADHDAKQLWICYPLPASIFADQALVYDIKSGSFGEADLPGVAFIQRGIIPDPGAPTDWDGQTGIWDDQINRWNTRLFNPTSDSLLMAGYQQQKIYAQDGFTQDGVGIPLLLQMLSKDLGAAQQYKLVNAIWMLSESVQVAGSGNTRVRIGSQKVIYDPISWGPAQSITADGKADFTVTGRYISIEISALQLNAWRLNSLDLDFRYQGKW